MDRRERYNERHRRYRARRRSAEVERNRELEEMWNFYYRLMDVNFTAVVIYEIEKHYQQHPEAREQDTIVLQDILRTLNLQRRLRKNPALLRATKSMKDYIRFERCV